MPFERFKNILDNWGTRIKETGSYILIGGGEPTLHPDFWKIVQYAKLYGFPWVATNGSNTEDALMLCNLARKGELRAVLSLDEWHAPIDPKVVEAFKEGLIYFDCGDYAGYWAGSYYTTDQRETRTEKIPLHGGRAKNLIKTNKKYCVCAYLHIRPNGDIYTCGCDDAPKIGTVDEGITETKYMYYPIINCCHKKLNPAFRV